MMTMQKLIRNATNIYIYIYTLRVPNLTGMVDIVQHLGPMMRALSCKPTEEELTNITNRFQNMNQNNQMTFQQFLQLMAPHIVKANEVYAEDKIEAAFRRFDIDGNGFISASELRIALKENFCKGMKGVAEAVTDEDVEEIMQEADLNGDGKINYMEFKEMIPNLSTAIHMPTKVK
jgi:calmodulin